MAEILAPCGSPQALQAALRAGCDAVYLGGSHFSARQNAANFSDEELKQAVYECHKRGVKVYQAVNTMIFDSQLEECMQAVKFACEIGIDGLITQDMALISVVKQCCPQLEIHSSTQMTIHTADGVEMSKGLGFSRAVLSRELPLDIIKELSQFGTETEVFVHGALCMSVSGQCYMSAVIGSRSANRGLCAQACRLPCSAVKGRERYDLSLKDMSYIENVKMLEKAGVSSLKIEGRMKRPEYAAKAVDSLKKALNGEECDIGGLEAVFSRGGFTDGYLFGKRGKEMFGTRQKENVEATANELPKIHEIYRREEKRDSVFFSFYAKSGEPVRLEVSDSGGVTVSVCGEIPQAAKKRECDEESVKKQLEKLGDTIYSLGGIYSEIESGLWISPSEINSLRREVCKKLDDKRAENNTKTVEFTPKDILDFKCIKTAETPAIRICVSELAQLENIDFEDIELCAVPLEIVEQAAKKYPVQKLMVSMPRFTFDEKKQREKLLSAKVNLGITKMLATNIAHIRQARDFGLEMHLDYGFNIGNSAALNEVKKLGAADAVVSFELKSAQINALRKPLPVGMFAYGKLPLMLTVNCPVSQAVGCKNCTKKIWDRTGREFKIKCSKKLGYVEVMNSEVLYLADKPESFSGADFITLNFCDESPAEVRKIISAYKYGSDKKPENLTRGLYFRGVL